MKKYIAIFLSAIMALFLVGNFICVDKKDEIESSSVVEEISDVTVETLKPEVIQLESNSIVNTSGDNNDEIIDEKLDEKTDENKSKISDSKVQTKSIIESNETDDEVVVDDELIESCDHDFCKTPGYGGEEGDVWEYTCNKCGYSYYESRYDEGFEISDDDFENCDEVSDVESFVDTEEIDSNERTIDEEFCEFEMSTIEELE